MKKIVVFSFFVMFLFGTDTFLLSPLLPSLQQKFSVLPEISGWMVGAYALGYFLLALVAGPLSDGMNRKKVLLWGLLGFALSTMLCGTATSFWLMCLYRFLAGVSAAFASPQVWAMLATLVPAEKRVQAMGVASAGLAFSQVVGLPLGGLLAQTDMSLPFYVIAGFSLLITCVGLSFLPSMLPPASGEQLSIRQRYTALFQITSAKSLFLGYFLLNLAGFAAFSFLGTWLHDSFSQNTVEIGISMIFLGIGNLVGSNSCGWVVRRFGSKSVLVACFLGVALLYLLMPHFRALGAVRAGLFLNFLIVGLLLPIAMTLLQSLSAAARGTIASLANATMYAATTVGSALAGVLYAKMGGFVVVGVFSALCFLLSCTMFVKKLARPQVPIGTVSKSQSE